MGLIGAGHRHFNLRVNYRLYRGYCGDKEVIGHYGVIMTKVIAT